LAGNAGDRRDIADKIKSKLVASAPVVSDRLALLRCAVAPAARQRPRPDAEIVGGEVSLVPSRASLAFDVGGLDDRPPFSDISPYEQS
jgi:hypothetical protein